MITEPTILGLRAGRFPDRVRNNVSVGNEVLVRCIVFGVALTAAGSSVLLGVSSRQGDFKSRRPIVLPIFIFPWGTRPAYEQ